MFDIGKQPIWLLSIKGFAQFFEYSQIYVFIWLSYQYQLVAIILKDNNENQIQDIRNKRVNRNKLFSKAICFLLTLTYYIVDFFYVYRSSVCYREDRTMPQLNNCRKHMTNVLVTTTDVIIFFVICNFAYAIFVIHDKTRNRDSRVSGAIKMKLREKTLLILSVILILEFIQQILFALSNNSFYIILESSKDIIVFL